jgi:hypothetical protein
MADRELIAAVPTAGLLPAAPLPLDPQAADWNEQTDLQHAMAVRAIEFYKLALAELP